MGINRALKWLRWGNKFCRHVCRIYQWATEVERILSMLISTGWRNEWLVLFGLRCQLWSTNYIPFLTWQVLILRPNSSDFHEIYRSNFNHRECFPRSILNPTSWLVLMWSFLKDKPWLSYFHHSLASPFFLPGRHGATTLRRAGDLFCGIWIGSCCLERNLDGKKPMEASGAASCSCNRAVVIIVPLSDFIQVTCLFGFLYIYLDWDMFVDAMSFQTLFEISELAQLLYGPIIFFIKRQCFQTNIQMFV